MSYIVTLQMDEQSTTFFEAMRQKHFSPERNVIAAHLTLFHTLPESTDVTDALRWVAGQWAPFKMDVTGLRSLGRGVAYTLRSTELMGVHRELSEVFRDHLTAQDQQKFGPHVVVQNKATGESARALQAELQGGFRPFAVEAVGLELWRYLGGPWELVERYGFEADPLITMRP